MTAQKVTDTPLCEVKCVLRGGHRERSGIVFCHLPPLIYTKGCFFPGGFLSLWPVPQQEFGDGKLLSPFALDDDSILSTHTRGQRCTDELPLVAGTGLELLFLSTPGTQYGRAGLNWPVNCEERKV